MLSVALLFTVINARIPALENAATNIQIFEIDLDCNILPIEQCARAEYPYL